MRVEGQNKTLMEDKMAHFKIILRANLVLCLVTIRLTGGGNFNNHNDLGSYFLQRFGSLLSRYN